uniref:HOX14I n=1 Tax=Eptatretus burgeri TaxID=7764 RepID=A0A220DLL3_EPTBU|nr:HOX14I [Eptatretus burgeri]
MAFHGNLGFPVGSTSTSFQQTLINHSYTLQSNPETMVSFQGDQANEHLSEESSRYSAYNGPQEPHIGAAPIFPGGLHAHCPSVYPVGSEYSAVASSLYPWTCLEYQNPMSCSPLVGCVDYLGNDQLATHFGHAPLYFGSQYSNGGPHELSDIPPTRDHQQTVRQRKKRIPYSKQQISELEKAFGESRFITPELRLSISERLSLTERQVKIWFQNQRQKEKKLERRTCGVLQ